MRCGQGERFTTLVQPPVQFPNPPSRRVLSWRKRVIASGGGQDKEDLERLVLESHESGSSRSIFLASGWRCRSLLRSNNSGNIQADIYRERIKLLRPQRLLQRFLELSRVVEIQSLASMSRRIPKFSLCHSRALRRRLPNLLFSCEIQSPPQTSASLVNGVLSFLVYLLEWA